MTRITVDVNDEWLDAAREVLGTGTKVGTINAALRAFAVRKQAAEIIAAFDEVSLDLDDRGSSWRYGGGRDLGALEAAARRAEAG